MSDACAMFINFIWREICYLWNAIIYLVCCKCLISKKEERISNIITISSEIEKKVPYVSETTSSDFELIDTEGYLQPKFKDYTKNDLINFELYGHSSCKINENTFTNDEYEYIADVHTRPAVIIRQLNQPSTRVPDRPNSLAPDIQKEKRSPNDCTLYDEISEYTEVEYVEIPYNYVFDHKTSEN